MGKGFEAGTIFLPQLLMSAEAAKAAFEVIKDRMASSGQDVYKRQIQDKDVEKRYKES